MEIGINMKKIIIALLLITTASAYGSTCTSISRTNNAANTILTSTKYNLDNNTAYNAINAADGGCISDNTLELAALNTTDFAVPLNAIKTGCEVSRTNWSTLSIAKCQIAVNGAYVKTTAATPLTWGGAGSSAEASSTSYYVYVKTGSTGATLNAMMHTTAPNGDGYNAAGDRVLARFYNDFRGDIDVTIQNWNGSGFEENRVCFLKDVKAKNTAGGTYTSGLWEQRSLNVMNTRGELTSGSCPFATIAASKFTLESGSYEILAQVPAAGVVKHISRLYNVSATRGELYGTGQSPGDAARVDFSFINGIVNLSAATQFSIQNWGQTTQATTGCGAATNLATETYAQVIIRKIK